MSIKLAKGKIIVISAPSGAGKTTIIKNLLYLFPELVFSVSATTRKKRAHERNGVDYFFLTEEEFNEKINNGSFVEWEKVYDNYYGTLKSFIDNLINEEKSVLLEVDVKGALSVKKKYGDAVLIFIDPPGKEELLERLQSRGTEKDEELNKRMERVEMELNQKRHFDYIVVNKDLNLATDQIKKILVKILNKEQTK